MPSSASAVLRPLKNCSEGSPREVPSLSTKASKGSAHSTPHQLHILDVLVPAVVSLN